MAKAAPPLDAPARVLGAFSPKRVFPVGVPLATSPVASSPLFEFSKRLLGLLLKLDDALVALSRLLPQLLLKLGDALVALGRLLPQPR